MRRQDLAILGALLRTDPARPQRATQRGLDPADDARREVWGRSRRRADGEACAADGECASQRCPAAFGVCAASSVPVVEGQCPAAAGCVEVDDAVARVCVPDALLGDGGCSNLPYGNGYTPTVWYGVDTQPFILTATP